MPLLRRVLLITLATVTLNTAIAAMLVLLGMSPAFWPAFVQSQSIGLSIAAFCWAVAPWVERAQGGAFAAIGLFGAAIAVGATAGIAVAAQLTQTLFGHGLAAAERTGGLVTIRTVVISLTLGVIGTLFFYGRELLRHARTRADAGQWRALAAERSAAQAKLQALRAQVEPHFLFNTLANVSALIDRDPVAARELVDQLARHLRSTLSHARAEVTTLGDELAMIESLLTIMKRRFGDRLRWRFDVPEALRQVAIPPMLVQPLVENAIKHGIEPMSAGGMIAVTARRDEDGALVVEVADTGRGIAGLAEIDGFDEIAERDGIVEIAGFAEIVGIDGIDGIDGANRGTPAGNTGTGLVNLCERLLAIYGPAARLALRRNAPQGTVARLTLPGETVIA